MTPRGQQTGRRPLRVLAWPAFRKQDANPYGALLATALRERGVNVDDWTPWRALTRSVDLWHLHHPDTVVYPRSSLHAATGAAALDVLLRIAARRGVRIVWTVHDLASNDGLHPRIERRLWRSLVPRIDALICLAEGSVGAARDRFPELRDVPTFTIPHGHYRDVCRTGLSRADAREALSLPADVRVLLHFGLVRPYKNLPHLITTFRRIDDPRLVLLVAGKPYDARIEREVRELAAGCPRIRLDLRWIPPESVETYFAASDLVVLPYRRVHNSGAVLLALTLARPVLVPDLGNMREHRTTYGPRWVMLFEGDLTAADLTDAAARCDVTDLAPPDLSDVGWDAIAERTIDVYESALGGRSAS